MTVALHHAPTKTELEAIERRKKFRAHIEAFAKHRDSVIVPVLAPPEPDPPAKVDSHKRDWLVVATPNGKLKGHTIKTIQMIVCADYKEDFRLFLSESRLHNRVVARQTSMWLCRILTPYSIAEIARRHGGRDHTTALHAFRRVKKILAGHCDEAQRIQRLHADLKNFLHVGLEAAI